MADNPLLVKRKPSSLERLHQWNRMAWMELAIIKKRIDILEEATKIDTGGDFMYAPDGNPWEPHIIYVKSPYIIPVFLAGIIAGFLVAMALLA